MDNICKVCGASFDTEKGLHLHIKKKHNMMLGEYYTKYYPRYNLLTKKVLPFKNKQEYFSFDFSNDSQMRKWIETNEDKDQVKKWMLESLKNRIKEKSLQKAPCCIELDTVKHLPSMDLYEKIFGSYEKACEIIKVCPSFRTNLQISKEVDPKNVTVCIDTREQKPLKFSNSIVQKLFVGDYTLTEENYTYTFVDRKSESDFKSTMSQGVERFKREIERAKKLGIFLYVVTESSVEKIEDRNRFQKWGSSNCEYIFHNMREILHQYDNIQFVFSKNRKNSEAIIPYLLMYGEDLWNIDVQYYLNKKGIL